MDFEAVQDMTFRRSLNRHQIIERMQAVRLPMAVHAKQRSEICGVCSDSMSQQLPRGGPRSKESVHCSVVGVLACGHVFHPECLEQTTPASLRHDPACPKCGPIEKAAEAKVVNILEPATLAEGLVPGNGSKEAPYDRAAQAL